MHISGLAAIISPAAAAISIVLKKRPGPEPDGEERIASAAIDSVTPAGARNEAAAGEPARGWGIGSKTSGCFLCVGKRISKVVPGKIRSPLAHL